MTVHDYINKKNSEYLKLLKDCAEKEGELQKAIDEKEAATITAAHFDGRISDAFAKRDQKRDLLLKQYEKAQHSGTDDNCEAKAAELKSVEAAYDIEVKHANESFEEAKKAVDSLNKIRIHMQNNNELITYDDATKTFEEAVEKAKQEKDKKISDINAKYSESPCEPTVDINAAIYELNMECLREVYILKGQQDRCSDEARDEHKKAQNALESHKNQSQERIKNFLKTAKSEIDRRNVSEDFSVGKKNDKDIKENILPETLCIGASMSEVDCKLVQDIYGTAGVNINSSITIDIRSGQNILIDVSENDYYTNSTLERVIVGLTLRYLESFPPEALCIHVVYEHEVSMVFETLKNIFKNENKDKIVSCGSKLTERLKSIREYINNNISRRLAGYNDIYDYFKDDQSGLAKMHLVVIPNGLGHAYKNDIVTIADLVQNKGKTCGLRFLIVNDYNADDSRDHDTIAAINKIKDASKVFRFHAQGDHDGYFEENGIRVNLTSLPADEDAKRFTEKQCSQYIRILKSCKRTVTYEDIGFGKAVIPPSDKYSPEISIPVGKTGNTVYEIPFHCESYNDRLVKHYLAVGKSGHGKSSLLHSIILNGAMKYSPHDLQFWLLDLKNGATSTEYLDSKIPHVRMAASENTPDDIYSMLLSVKEEWQHRQQLFENIGKKYSGHAFNSIHKYNEFVDKYADLQLTHLSRIVIIIDEAQDIFDNETFDEAIDKLLGQLVAKTRYVGIHFFLLANPFARGRSKLNGGYMSQCDGKFYFRLDESDVENVNFGQDLQRKAKEAAVHTFPAGHIIGTVDNKVFDEVQLAYTGGSIAPYEKQISEKYKNYPCKRIIMGQTTPLSETDNIIDIGETYQKLLQSPEIKRVDEEPMYRTIFGSESFSTKPVFFEFSPITGAPHIVGTNRTLASSIAYSMVESLAHLNCDKEIHIVKGAANSPFVKLLATSSGKDTVYYSGADVDKMIYYLYEQLCYRKSQIEHDFVGEFKPIFAYVNNIDSFEKVQQNILLEAPQEQADNNSESDYTPVGDMQKVIVDDENYILFDEEDADGEDFYDNDFSLEDLDKSDAKLSEQLKSIQNMSTRGASQATASASSTLAPIGILNAIEKLCKEGPRNNIYLSFYTGEQSIRDIANILKTSDQVVIVDKLAQGIDFDEENAVKSSLIASMLKKIKDSNPDTQAVWVKDRITCYKIRPIIYNT